jgi:phosphoribosyl 1,2-cyclic phosphodiesterase
MIGIKINGSSSSGNNYVLTDGDSSIMLEAGISPKKLANKGVKLTEIEALLVTHEHGDHTKYASDLLLSGSFDLWASHGTLEAIGLDRRCHALRDHVQQKIGDWLILPFSTVHDDLTSRVREPLGFFIQSPSGERIVFATDTNRINAVFPKVNYWLVECNHTVELVRECKRPKSVQDRILKTHMSFDSLKTYFEKVDLTNTKEIILLHLSGENSEPKRYKQELEELTGKKVTIA